MSYARVMESVAISKPFSRTTQEHIFYNGASGEAHSFACEDTAFYLPEIETYIGMVVPMESVTSEILADELKPRKRITRDRVPQRPNGKGGKPSGNKSRARFAGKPRNGGYKGKKSRPKST